VTSISGVEFDDAWIEHIRHEVDGVGVPFLSRSAMDRLRRDTKPAGAYEGLAIGDPHGDPGSEVLAGQRFMQGTALLAGKTITYIHSGAMKLSCALYCYHHPRPSWRETVY
jgi:hypothetical protein